MTDREKLTHKTWGCIRWSRFTGRTRFFASDLHHDSGVHIELHEVDVERNLSRTWIFPNKIILGVRMAESQFAEFLTTPNRGGGVPCTIEHRHMDNWRQMGEVKQIPSEYDLHREEGKKTIKKSIEGIKGLREKVDELKISAKAKKEIDCLITTIERNIRDNVDFVEDSFERRMNDIVQRAKTDIEAFNYHSRLNAGLPAKELPDERD